MMVVLLFMEGMRNNMSETGKHRSLFLPYCVGDGLDIGFGGDPITDTAICLDMPERYSYVGNKPQHLHGDARNLFMFTNNCLDYVYSSHCIEDFEHTKDVLQEWLRVIKFGGHLCLLFPDEQVYLKKTHCANAAHKHKNFGLKYVLNILSEISISKFMERKYSLELVFTEELFPHDDYNCAVICTKIAVKRDTV